MSAHRESGHVAVIQSERLVHRDRAERAGAVLLIASVAALMLFTGVFEPIEHRLTTWRAQLLDRPPTGQVAIVEIDAKSLGEISTWPWSRRYHAEALDRLHASKAAMVAFDVDFSSSSDPEGDAAFAGALDRGGLTILPTFQQTPSDRPSDELMKTEPAKMFSSAWVGGVNILPGGTDGVVRDYPAAIMIGGRIRPSMAVLVAENDDFGDRTFQPDWGIDAGKIPRFSFVDVVKGRVPPRAVAGKRILIGATAVELGDRYTIPRFGTVPGVVVQALAAESLLQGRALSRSGHLPTLIILILSAVALGIRPRARFGPAFALQAIAVLVLLLGVPIMIQARWPLSLDSAAALSCAAVCIVARILLEVRRRHGLTALVDSETGLPNGRALEARLLELASSPVILATAGIDRFESIRNAISTEALVELVREVSKRVERATGQSAYRIAPDVLAWVEPGNRDRFAAAEVLGLFVEPVLTGEGPIDVDLSIGLDDEPVGANARSKIERGIAAIAMARAAGEDSHWYQSIDPSVRRQLSLMGELRRGMKRGEVEIAYQPKLDIARGTIANAEALVRWCHPQEGMIAPDLFIPLAESTGVIRELTDYVLSRALADCKAARKEGHDLSIAVNVSAADIGRGDFASEIKELMARLEVDPAWLTLEVTESAILRSAQKAIDALTALRNMGVQLSIDDYGTGQSTLSYLKQLPVNELKVDKSFVMSLCDVENDRIMVRSTIDLAHELGMKVVAEGVESAEILGVLAALGCDHAQGYFIGKAMPFNELMSAVQSTRLSDAA